MGVLTAQELADLQADLSAGGFGDSWSYRIQTAGTWGSWIAIELAITTDQTEEAFNESDRHQYKDRIVSARPLAAVLPALKLGDQISPDAGTTIFVVRQISGSSLPRWDAVHRSSLAVSAAEGFQAEGNA